MCPGRSWQSIKGRFDKNILPTLNRFGTTRTELSEADGKVKTASAAVVTEEGNAPREARMSYSRAEDLAILGFIADVAVALVVGSGSSKRLSSGYFSVLCIN